MHLGIILKVVGAIIAIVIVIRVFGIKPLELWNRTAQAADSAAADIRDIASGKKQDSLGREVSGKAAPGKSAETSDKPLTEVEQMQRDLEAERERFLKARRDAVNESREKVLKGELDDHKRKREANSRGTGE